MLSTAGKNLRNVMYKHNLNYNSICRCTYIMQLPNIFKTLMIIAFIMTIHVSVITDCIAMRDHSAQYASLSYEEASEPLALISFSTT